MARRARPGETVVTLDGQTRALGEQMLVIADAARAVAVAGVMGGANTEVRDATRTVLLESAYFAPGSIRRTAKALGLSTEASYRFERGADIEGLRDALDRAARLIAELGEGRVAAGVLDAYPAPRRPLAVLLRLARIERVVEVPASATVADILRGLGFRRRSGRQLRGPVPASAATSRSRTTSWKRSRASGATRRSRRRCRRARSRSRGDPVTWSRGCRAARPERRGPLRGRLAVADRPAHLRHLGLSTDDTRSSASRIR